MPPRRGKRDKSGKKASAPVITDIPTLLQKAEENIDKLEWKVALMYLRRALELDPENIAIMDKNATALMELGDTDEAFPLLVKSAQVDPEHNFEKWMYLGQLQSGNDSVTCYRKGIQIMEGELNNMEDEEAKQLILNRLCGAYCSIAEIYMTDLCEEEEAESTCESCILHSISISPNNVESLVMLASCRMSQCRFDEAEATLMQVNDIIAAIDTTNDMLPAYGVRLFAGKMLLELDNDDSCRDRCEAAINLFDQLLLEDDQNDELLFLMATAHLNLQSYEMGIEFGEELEKRLKKMLKRSPNVPELQAQNNEVIALLKDLREGLIAYPEAKIIEATEMDTNMDQE